MFINQSYIAGYHVYAWSQDRAVIIGKRVGVGVIDSWIKPADWEQGDHVTKLFVMPFEEDACSVAVAGEQHNYICGRRGSITSTHIV